MVEANNQNKNAIDLFQKMGVQINDTNGDLKSADTVFREMMSSLGDLESDMERNTLLMKMFGESGAIFAQSGVVGAMDEFVSLGREFGLDVGPEAVKQAADFQRAMADLSAVGTGAMQDILIAITGTNGLTAAIDSVSSSIIFVKAAFVAAFNAIETPISIVNSRLLTLNYLLQGDFEMAGNALAQGGIDAAENWDQATSAFENARKEIEALGKARAKIRGGGGQDELETPSRSKAIQETKGETKAAEKLFEVRKDDLDVTNQMIQSQTKLQQINQKLSQGEISDFEKVRIAHRERLEMIDETIVAEQNARMERTKELQKALDDGTISEEKYFERRTQMFNQHLATIKTANESRFRSEEKLQLDLMELEKQNLDEMTKKRSEMIRNYFNDVHHLASGITSAIIDIQDQTVNHFVENRDAAIENIKKLEEQGTITAEESAIRRENIENAYQEKIEKQVMKAFRMKQAAAISTILIDMALTTSRAMKDYKYPVSLGIAALAAGKAGLELAAVKSQTPPKFDVGGMVGQSDPLAPDQTQAQLLTGEAVLDRSTVQRIGGEQGLRDLQNAQKTNTVVVQPFKHFDRFLNISQKRGLFGTKRGSRGY